MILTSTQQTLFNRAKQKFGHKWFDGDDLLADFHDGCSRDLGYLVKLGMFESEGFHLRAARNPPIKKPR